MTLFAKFGYETFESLPVDPAAVFALLFGLWMFF
jgi:hypothetical protein